MMPPLSPPRAENEPFCHCHWPSSTSSEDDELRAYLNTPEPPPVPTWDSPVNVINDYVNHKDPDDIDCYVQ